MRSDIILSIVFLLCISVVLGKSAKADPPQSMIDARDKCEGDFNEAQTHKQACETSKYENEQIEESAKCLRATCESAGATEAQMFDGNQHIGIADEHQRLANLDVYGTEPDFEGINKDYEAAEALQTEAQNHESSGEYAAAEDKYKDAGDAFLACKADYAAAYALYAVAWSNYLDAEDFFYTLFYEL